MYLAVKAVLRKMKEQNQHSIDRSRPKLMEALHGVYYSNKFYYSSLLQLACHRYLKVQVVAICLLNEVLISKSGAIKILKLLFESSVQLFQINRKLSSTKCFMSNKRGIQF
jgi:hypothetical protein